MHRVIFKDKNNHTDYIDEDTEKEALERAARLKDDGYNVTGIEEKA